MKHYQVFVDVPQDADWEEITVEQIIVQANDAEEARDKAAVEVEKSYEDFYVWEVTEDDIITP